MKCPRCLLIEMLVKGIKENLITYECKKCGFEAQEPLPEEIIENEESK